MPVAGTKTRWRTLANGFRFKVETTTCANCGERIIREFRSGHPDEVVRAIETAEPTWFHTSRTASGRRMGCGPDFRGKSATPMS